MTPFEAIDAISIISMADFKDPREGLLIVAKLARDAMDTAIIVADSAAKEPAPNITHGVRESDRQLLRDLRYHAKYIQGESIWSRAVDAIERLAQEALGLHKAGCDACNRSQADTCAILAHLGGTVTVSFRNREDGRTADGYITEKVGDGDALFMLVPPDQPPSVVQ